MIVSWKSIITLVVGIAIGIGIGFWWKSSPTANAPSSVNRPVAVPPPSDLSRAPAGTAVKVGATSSPLLPGERVTAPTGAYNPPK